MSVYKGTDGKWYQVEPNKLNRGMNTCRPVRETRDGYSPAAGAIKHVDELGDSFGWMEPFSLIGFNQ